MIDIIIILGILFIIWIVNKLTKKRKKVIFDQPYESPKFGESIYYRHLCHEYAVMNLELLVNMKKTSLGMALKMGHLTYSEYGKLFDELMEWKKQKWEEIYKND